MPTSLTRTYQSGANLYATIRLSSDGTVWNGTAFEAWSNANIANYDVALTDNGGDYYSADFPAAITAGDYRVTYYVRAGGAPATTDNILGTETWNWNGAALSPSSDVVLSAYALTTLENMARFPSMGSDMDNTLATICINAASAEIERATGIEFALRDRRERFNGLHSEVRLTRPRAKVRRITYGAAPALTISYTGSGIQASASVYNDYSSATSGGLLISSVSATGVETSNDLTFASYPSVQVLAAAVNAVSGWTATVNSNQPSYDLNPDAFGDPKLIPAIVCYPHLPFLDYRVDFERGIISPTSGVDRGFFNGYGGGLRAGGTHLGPRRFGHGEQEYLVRYTHGWATIPDDVAWLATELATEKYFYTVANPSIKQTTLGPYSTTFASADYESIRTRLAKYMGASAFIGGLQ